MKIAFQSRPSLRIAILDLSRIRAATVVILIKTQSLSSHHLAAALYVWEVLGIFFFPFKNTAYMLKSKCITVHWGPLDRITIAHWSSQGSPALEEVLQGLRS